MDPLKYLTYPGRILTRVPAAFIIVVELLLWPFFHGSQNFVTDLADDIVYFGMFLFGYVYAADDGVRRKFDGYIRLSAATGALSLALLFYLNYQWAVHDSGAEYLIVLWGLGRGFYECSAVIFLVSAAKRRLYKESRAIKRLSKSSFTVYIVHISFSPGHFLHPDFPAAKYKHLYKIRFGGFALLSRDFCNLRSGEGAGSAEKRRALQIRARRTKKADCGIKRPVLAVKRPPPVLYLTQGANLSKIGTAKITGSPDLRAGR